MTEKEAKTLPLWEVWEKFQIANRGIKWAPKTKTHRLMIQQEKDEAAMLRGVLLERVESELGLSITCGDVCRITRNRDHFVTTCGTERAKNESAGWAFMAWELEQRKEVNGEL